MHDIHGELLAPQAMPAKDVWGSPVYDGPECFSRASSADTHMLGRERSSDLNAHSMSPLASPTVCPTAAIAKPISFAQASKMVHAESVAVCWSLAAWLNQLEMPDKEIMDQCVAETAVREPIEQALRVEEADTMSVTSGGSSVGSAKQHHTWGVGRDVDEEDLDCHEERSRSFDAMLMEGYPTNYMC